MKKIKIKKVPDYENSELDIKLRVEAPSYEVCLDWMRELPDSRAATMDFWARGNFVRRLLYNRNIGVHPIMIPVAHPEQMRWVYRRLALTGIAVDFIYTGELAKPQWIKHYQPLDVNIDSGWGYIAFGGTILRSPTGRRWWSLLGFASLMPESVVQWLVEEAERPFASGRLFIAPAELIGLNRAPRLRQLDALAQVAAGSFTTEIVDPAMAVLDMEIPWIDGMPSADFEKLLLDHQTELNEFQVAFSQLVSGYHVSSDQATAARRRVSDAVDALIRSSQHSRLRAMVSKCKGSITTFPVAMGVLAAAGAAYSGDPFAGAAVAAAAGKALRDLWNQSRTDTQASSPSPYRVLLRLGVDKVAFRAGQFPMAGAQLPQARTKKIGPYHWVCPPTCGLRSAMLKE